MVDNWARRFMDSVLPGNCLLCQQRLGAAAIGGICPACTRSLPWIANPCTGCALPLPGTEIGHCADCQRSEPAFDWAWSAFRLAAPVQGMIHQLKYSAGFTGGHSLGLLLAHRLARRALPMPQLLIPVPLHSRRLRLRGYNQALELARTVGGVLSVPLAPQSVARTKATIDQIGQSAVERRRNLRGAFTANVTLSGKHIALIDDVMTTGTTLAELAKACRKAGAARVEAWSLARVLKPG